MGCIAALMSPQHFLSYRMVEQKLSKRCPTNHISTKLFQFQTGQGRQVFATASAVAIITGVAIDEPSADGGFKHTYAQHNTFISITVALILSDSSILRATSSTHTEPKPCHRVFAIQLIYFSTVHLLLAIYQYLSNNASSSFVDSPVSPANRPKSHWVSFHTGAA